ncbi:MAG: DUF3791 domain-containing protein [Neisseriaceae bacterium]|nr:DUF3791 domain-containing protein [Neisseriaceae bacterium]MBP5789630.1 DUF3791 domain-containing protein [Neisseriaceae bacterium]
MNTQHKKIAYSVACIAEFAKLHQINLQESFRYLYHFKAIEFLKENYDIEHLLPFETVMEDLNLICQKNGGVL